MARVSRAVSSCSPVAAGAGRSSSSARCRGRRGRARRSCGRVAAMAAALVLLLVALGAMAAGVLIGRYYVPDDRQLRRTARHSRAYMRALSHLIARDHETVMAELRAVVEENVEDTEPYFALGALFRSRGEHERAIRVHQALAVRERDRRKLRHRAMYELGLDFRAAGMPRRATRAMENVLAEEPAHEGALRGLAG